VEADRQVVAQVDAGERALVRRSGIEYANEGATGVAVQHLDRQPAFVDLAAIGAWARVHGMAARSPALGPAAGPV
jgi:hypothetical protein